MKLTKKQSNDFQKTVYNYYKKSGRHTLPWRNKTATPYHILVSEIMLQQTQVDRVIPKYRTFLQSFPSAKKLSEATTQVVLQHWVGLGYNRRALNLQKAAQHIANEYKGKVPRTFEQLITLPGIGPYTAGAVLNFAFNVYHPIIETNIRTVYIFHFLQSKKEVDDKQLLTLIEQTSDTNHPQKWFWALMDYGSHLKKIHGNLNKQSKTYAKQSTFKGSIREVRGAIIKQLTVQKSITKTSLRKLFPDDEKRINEALASLLHERIIKQEKQKYFLV